MTNDTNRTQQFREMNLDQLTEWMGNSQPDTVRWSLAAAELERRRFMGQEETGKAQMRAAEAEQRAANAAIETAHHAEKNAKYMLWSVIFAALSALISLATTLYTNWPKRPVDRPPVSDPVKYTPFAMAPQIPTVSASLRPTPDGSFTL
jgi:hypothetical protein